MRDRWWRDGLGAAVTSEHPPVPTVAVPPQVVVPHPGPLEGCGAFTAGNASSALRAVGLADWVAVQLGFTTADDVIALRHAGIPRVYGWSSPNPFFRPESVLELGCDPVWVGQIEGDDEARLVAASSAAGVARFAIGKPDNLTAEPWPAGVPLVLECYWNTNPGTPPSRADARGVALASIAFGIFPEGSRRSLAEYLADCPAGLLGHWSVWDLDQMPDEDWQTWAAWRSANPPRLARS